MIRTSAAAYGLQETHERKIKNKIALVPNLPAPAPRSTSRVSRIRRHERFNVIVSIIYDSTRVRSRPAALGSHQAGRTRDRRTTHCKSRGERRSLSSLLGCTHRKARCRPGIGHAVKLDRHALTAACRGGFTTGSPCSPASRVSRDTSPALRPWQARVVHRR